MCTPHDEKGKPVYGRRFVVSVEVISNDGKTMVHKGVFDLCDPDARPLLGAIEYVDQMNLAAEVEPPEPPHVPPKANVAEPEKPPAPEGEEKQEFTCGMCSTDVNYMQRGRHANGEHGIKAWDIR